MIDFFLATSCVFFSQEGLFPASLLSVFISKFYFIATVVLIGSSRSSSVDAFDLDILILCSIAEFHLKGNGPESVATCMYHCCSSCRSNDGIQVGMLPYEQPSYPNFNKSLT